MHVQVIGLDLGTQSVKAVVCDARLTVRGAHAQPIETAYPAPGRAEQDPRAWERALGPAIAGALVAAGATPMDIGAVALTGQVDGCVAVDAAGAPVCPALIWQDRRAVAEAGLALAHEVFAITGQVADPSHLAPKIAWLRAHAPAAARFHLPVSYLVARLTGAHVIDPALASTTMLFELATGRWSAALLAAYGVHAPELPELRDACAVAGGLTAEGARLTGLRAGTPVAVGTGDDFTNVLGAGAASPGGAVVCAIGTAEVVGAVTAAPIFDRLAAAPLVETHAFPTGASFVEHPGWLAGGAVRWAVRMLGLEDDAALDALAASAPPGAGGVTFLPSLAGAMTPAWRPGARGSFHGLAASHGPAHVARAVLEGLTFATRDVTARLEALGIPVREVVLVGGGARSRVWAQLRADVLGKVHRIGAWPDASPIGAAMIAAVAAGLSPDLVTAAALVPPATETFIPGPPEVRAALDEAYARARGLDAVLATWEG